MHVVPLIHSLECDCSLPIVPLTLGVVPIGCVGVDICTLYMAGSVTGSYTYIYSCHFPPGNSIIHESKKTFMIRKVSRFY